MGCDIHIFAETKRDGKWQKVGDYFSMSDFDKEYYKKEKTDAPFGWRSYSMFAFFAGVRNYDHCAPISDPRGLPKDSEYLNEEIDDGWNGKTTRLRENFDWEYHSRSHLYLRELLEFDYEQTFWNRRVSKEVSPGWWNGAALAEEGEGLIMPYRENLGEEYFRHLEELKSLGKPDDVRIVFWFDN